jgi:hypothetical protein
VWLAGWLRAGHANTGQERPQTAPCSQGHAPYRGGYGPAELSNPKATYGQKLGSPPKSPPKRTTKGKTCPSTPKRRTQRSNLAHLKEVMSCAHWHRLIIHSACLCRPLPGTALPGLLAEGPCCNHQHYLVHQRNSSVWDKRITFNLPARAQARLLGRPHGQESRQERKGGLQRAGQQWQLVSPLLGKGCSRRCWGLDMPATPNTLGGCPHAGFPMHSLHPSTQQRDYQLSLRRRPPPEDISSLLSPAAAVCKRERAGRLPQEGAQGSKHACRHAFR